MGGIGAGEGWSPTSDFQSFLLAVHEEWTVGSQRGCADGRGVGSWGREGAAGQSLRGWWERGAGDSGWDEGGVWWVALLPSSG